MVVGNHQICRVHIAINNPKSEIAKLVGDIETRLILTVHSGGSDQRHRRFRKVALKWRERDALSCDACHELLSTATARCVPENGAPMKPCGAPRRSLRCRVASRCRERLCR